MRLCQPGPVGTECQEKFTNASERGSQFESPLLHHPVRRSRSGFLVCRTNRDYNGLRVSERSLLGAFASLRGLSDPVCPLVSLTRPTGSIAFSTIVSTIAAISPATNIPSPI